jgi:hypothetical protein
MVGGGVGVGVETVVVVVVVDWVWAAPQEEVKGMCVVAAVSRRELSKSIVPGLVKARTRERVRSMPQGCVCSVGERRCVIMPREMMVRPGRIMVRVDGWAGLLSVVMGIGVVVVVVILGFGCWI